MRSFAFGTLLSLGLASISSTDARVYTPRSSRTIGGLLGRQTTTDVCANISGPLKVQINGVSVIVGIINTCLCESTIPQFLQTNVVAIAAVSIAGNAAVTATLTSMITSSTACTYPENAVPACSADGSSCSFSCINGFSVPTSDPSMCTCEAPAAVCNGVCTTDACPSSVVTPARRRYANSLRKRAMCPAGTTACGIYERRGARSSPWECIDTMSDLESCGGCVNPLDAFSPRGVDCTAIPGVVDVACVSGACVVNRCAAGYTRTQNGGACISAMLQQD